MQKSDHWVDETGIKGQMRYRFERRCRRSRRRRERRVDRRARFEVRLGRRTGRWAWLEEGLLTRLRALRGLDVVDITCFLKQKKRTNESTLEKPAQQETIQLETKFACYTTS